MSWMSTFTGRRIDVENPRLEDIDIRDIAHHLSLLCRFGGACKFHYSVAQHTLLCVACAPIEHKLEAFFHDAPEYAYGDVIQPLKKKDCYDAVREMHQKFDTAVYRRFGLLSPTQVFLGLSPEVRKIDAAVCLAEGEQLCTSTKGWSLDAKEAAPVHIIERDWREVEQEFLKTYEDLHDL